MRIEQISLKQITISILVLLGLLSIVLSFAAAVHYRSAALAAQASTLSRVVDVASAEVLKELRTQSVNLGTMVESQGELRGLMREAVRNPGDNAVTNQIVAHLDQSYQTRFVGAGILDLAKLRVYDADLNLVAESTKGHNSLAPQLPAFMHKTASGRTGANRLKHLSGLWNSADDTLYSTLVPVGGLQLAGYLEVVTAPAHNLRHVADLTKTPLTILNVRGERLHRSPDWKDDADSGLEVKLDLPAADGEPALQLTVLENVEGLFGAMRKTQATATIGIIVLTGAALLVALWLFQSFLFKPLHNLVTDMERCSHGDLSTTVNTRSLKEFHAVADSFNAMATQVRNSIEHERQAADDVRGKVELILDVVAMAGNGNLTGQLMVYRDQDIISELANGVQRMLDSLNSLVSRIQQSGISVTSSATEIAATASQQEATVSEQAATTNQIKATVTEISATAKELVKTMDEVTDVAWKTSEGANHGRSSLERMEKTMRQMMEATAAISAKLAVLSEKAGNINTVVTTINKVADQTNLLSLNAAIEAEKAGEYGVGFAVVATEIRRLADQTAVATWDIEQMVKEMQSAVSAGVMGMEKFSEEVRRGVDDVRDVGSQLAQIIEQVEMLIPRFEEVHEGMQSQAQGASQISEAMVQLSEAAQQTAESLRQSNNAIHQLNDAAHSLQEGASHFRVVA